mmetsp:Transcript_15143/g.26805  ORF Transcript_15143/g.26805 Transcript_15143/m.26805 type:complete len:220 (+) Transcript_15143:1201-1860(+)
MAGDGSCSTRFAWVWRIDTMSLFFSGVAGADGPTAGERSGPSPITSVMSKSSKKLNSDIKDRRTRLLLPILLVGVRLDFEQESRSPQLSSSMQRIRFSFPLPTKEKSETTSMASTGLPWYEPDSETAIRGRDGSPNSQASTAAGAAGHSSGNSGMFCSPPQTTLGNSTLIEVSTLSIPADQFRKMLELLPETRVSPSMLPSGGGRKSGKSMPNSSSEKG